MVDLETTLLNIYGNYLRNHMVDVYDAIVKRFVEPKARIPRRGTLAFGSTHRFTIASYTSTIWFPRSLPYMVNHVVFKVKHLVQGQSTDSRSTTDSSRPILLSTISLTLASASVSHPVPLSASNRFLALNSSVGKPSLPHYSAW